MGLQIPPSPTPPPSTTTTTTTTSPTPPKSVSQLPPEALDLATKLFDLARSGSTAPLHQYLLAGIPPNLTNHVGDTLLMLAAYHGHLSTVTMLLEQGADPNVLNERGQSPLAGAVFKGYGEVVGALVGAGGDVWAGRPSAVETAGVFRRGDLLGVMGVEGEGEGEEGQGRVGDWRAEVGERLA
ncbi:hypothetical protein LTR91_005077 [Friedmanniomyces endolithicus]|uniref:Ankyrin n=1 Tax=Friedmanniomyces endolithicus TaxID=329885 RepID=A0AAN6KTR7_9PEZI|nr:hypothetical protein LTR94_003677 [Friedmanniomyces endolithicus]KAK0770492.1 hypothetical protein LTR59_016493 [Friedmanniomyces endolithicus]KAK0814097.1 hypothetical protein LTR38_002872 [Friedmanniomyces endolithicus]KAK0820594.1 hypothetical protein LTR75_001472 [Friedmanniomyces endolithicus]KAK0838200.1 hypothetical protein LTS02_017810 [Friedmanniomyces endolithicus]